MFTGKYQSVTLSNDNLLEGGFINAWAAPISSFSVIRKPILTFDPMCGDAYIISESHEWLTGQEPIELLVKKDTLETEGESVGDIGGGRMLWKPKLFLKGDGANAEEILSNLLNEPFIFFVRDLNYNGGFIQFGCEQLPADVEKKTGKSGTLVSGGKGNELIVRSFCRFFYQGIIPVLNTLFDSILTDDGLSLESDDGKAFQF